MRYIVTQANSTLHHWWNIIDTETGGATVAAFHGSVPNVEQEAGNLCHRLNQIGGTLWAPSIVDIGTVLHRIDQRLDQIQNEVSKLSTQDTALTQAVTDLVSAFTDNTTAIEAEIAALKAQIVAGDDPVVDTAVTNLENLVTTMKASTAAAQAAIAPPAPPAPTPTPAPAAPAAGSTTTGS